MFSLIIFHTIYLLIGFLFLFIIYAVFQILREYFAIKKIDTDSIGRGITTGGIKPFKDAEIHKTQKLLLGLSKMDAIIIPVNIILALATVAGLMHAVGMDEQTKRPFIDLYKSSIQYTQVAIDSKRFNGFIFETYLVNNGELPAHFDITKHSNEGYQGVIWSPEEGTSGFLFPKQQKRISWILEWNNESEELLKWAKEERDPRYLCVVCGISLTVDYGLLEDKSTGRYFTTLNSEKTRTPDGRIGRFEFSFMVKDAR